MKSYEELKMDIQWFSETDVITASVTGGTATKEEGTQVDPFGAWFGGNGGY